MLPPEIIEIVSFIHVTVIERKDLKLSCRAGKVGAGRRDGEKKPMSARGALSTKRGKLQVLAIAAKFMTIVLLSRST